MVISRTRAWRRRPGSARTWVLASACAIAVSALAACSSGGATPGAASVGGGVGGAAASGGNAQGVTSTSINVGVIMSKTGFYSFESMGVERAFEAVVNYSNAHGGVYSRKINLTVVDDTSTAAGNKSAAQSLVQARGAFVVVDNSGTQSGGGAYLQSQNVPTFGSNVDVAVSTFHNFFAPTGGAAINPNEVLTTTGLIFKKLGVTKVGSIGLAVSQASVNAAKDGIASAQMVGLQGGYFNPNLQAGNASWTPYILGFKDSGTNGYLGAVDQPDAIAFVAAAKQQGLPIKSLISNLFVNSLLTGTTASAMQGVYVTSSWRPTQIPSPATQQELTILHAAGIQGQADFQSSTGYTLGVLLVKGLEEAGKNPTRSAILTNLRAVHDWNAGGLAPGIVDFSKEFSDPPLAVGNSGCEWLLVANGSQFVPVQTAPICGTKRTIG